MKRIFLSLILLVSFSSQAADSKFLEYTNANMTRQFSFRCEGSLEDGKQRFLVDITTLYDGAVAYSNGMETELCAVDLTSEQAELLAAINRSGEIEAFVKELGLIEN